MRRSSALPAVLALTLAVIWLLPREAGAIPAFARQVHQKCSFCHVAFPKLNEFGLTFKANGYRLPGTQGLDVWDIPALPVSIVTQIDGIWDSNRGAKDDLTIEQPELSLLWGTNFGPHISSFGEIVVGRDGEGADLGPVFIQFDDLAGKEGQLNLKVGVYDMDFGFLAAARHVLFEDYTAEDLGFFPTAIGIELNGQILPGEYNEGGLTVRYYAGGTLDRTDDIAADSQSDISNSGYATVALTYQGQKLALHYQHQNGDSADDDRWAIATELTAMDAYLNLAYFAVSRQNDDPAVNGGDDLKGHDWMAELVVPVRDYVFGLRYDLLDNKGFPYLGEDVPDAGDMVKLTAHASWYVRPNVQVGVEFGRKDFKNTPDATDSTTGRLIARFGF